MKVLYAEANYSHEEIDAASKVMLEHPHALMGGSACRKLEKQVAALFRKKYGLMTNSGSSANLLGIQSLGLKPGSKVITPALTFSTTIAPLVQSGLIPLFVDVDPDTLQLDHRHLYTIDTTDVSAVCVPNLIGNLPNWRAIAEFATDKKLQVIEDSADTIGYKYEEYKLDWSDVTTTSFYASHVVTGAGFGGLAAFKNEEHYQRALSLRSWGRRSSQYGETEDFERRFSATVDGIPYDDKYIFDDLGYNFIPSEISAAFALQQIDKLEKNIDLRRRNFSYLKNGLSSISTLRTFEQIDGVTTGWLAFPIQLTGKFQKKRRDLQIKLEKNQIQTRTVFTGNVTRQPVAKKFNWEVHGALTVADQIMESGLLIGCHSKLSIAQLDFVIEQISEFANG